MEINYRAETKAANFGSKHVEPKIKLIIKNSIYLKGFYDSSKPNHNPKWIYFALKITQNKLTKST